MAGIIIMALGLMAISEGPLAIVVLCIALVLLGILAFVDIAWFTVVCLVCAGGIIIWVLIKKKNVR